MESKPWWDTRYTESTVTVGDCMDQRVITVNAEEIKTDLEKVKDLAEKFISNITGNSDANYKLNKFINDQYFAAVDRAGNKACITSLKMYDAQNTEYEVNAEEIKIFKILGHMYISLELEGKDPRNATASDYLGHLLASKYHLDDNRPTARGERYQKGGNNYVEKYHKYKNKYLLLKKKLGL